MLGFRIQYSVYMESEKYLEIGNDYDDYCDVLMFLVMIWMISGNIGNDDGSDDDYDDNGNDFWVLLSE